MYCYDQLFHKEASFAWDNDANGGKGGYVKADNTIYGWFMISQTIALAASLIYFILVMKMTREGGKPS